MRLKEVARSDAWPGAHAHDGLTGLLVPSPVLLDDALHILAGRRDGAGASSIWALRVNRDLTDADLVPVPVAGSLPEYCSSGMIPTDVRVDHDAHVTVLFSGFRTRAPRFQLLSGALWGELGTGAPMHVTPEPVLPPVPGQDVVRAGATFDRGTGSGLLYAAGGEWVQLAGGVHPASQLWRKPEYPEMEAGQLVLSPRDDEFALTRPVAFNATGHSLLFFSRRMRDGRYIQGLARWEPEGKLVRCDEEFSGAPGVDAAYMYAHPFTWQGRTLAAVAFSRLGDEGLVILELEFL
jgi:hypothetical protein